MTEGKIKKMTLKEIIYECNGELMQYIIRNVISESPSRDSTYIVIYGPAALIPLESLVTVYNLKFIPGLQNMNLQSIKFSNDLHASSN